MKRFKVLARKHAEPFRPKGNERIHHYFNTRKVALAYIEYLKEQGLPFVELSTTMNGQILNCEKV
jgi:MoaA/NifB/PqqE/SkfB family radical SAM enzyme